MATERATYTPYKPIYDGSVHHIIKTGKYKEPPMQSQLSSLGIQVIEAPGGEGDCQSWAFERLGLSEYAHSHIELEDLSKLGFQQTKKPAPGDLIFYNWGHYGILYDKFHGKKRIISKLGIKGAVCIHPWNALTRGGIYKPKYFKRTLNK